MEPTHADAGRTGPLDGIVVLELGTLIAGPFAGRLLGDMGARVIKIEDPGRPDPLRTWGQGERDGRRHFWTVHARNKESVTLDLRSDDGAGLFLDLVARADVVVENFRPGTLEKWGLGPDRLHEINPGLVIGRVSGYGQTGPQSARAGYASVAEGVSGLRHLNGFPDRPPPRLALSLGDTLGGMFAAQGILAALLSRATTGRGQVVDVALTEACLAVQESVIPDYDAAGVIRGPSGTRLEGIAPSNLYQSSDGVWVIIAANQDTVFRRLCGAMGRPELAHDPRFVDHSARGANQDEIDGIIADWAGQRPAEEIRSVLDAAGVVVGPVNTVADVMVDEQFLARGMLVPHTVPGVHDTVLGPGVVPVLDTTPGSVRRGGAPEPGWDNRAVYSDLLGLDDERLADLTARGVI
ncbi:CaiB/BaiF CoA-transferase family protein [Rhodococcus sp. IEGM 1408]|uniref:CaiB/BaiF CoA transferase family protein n=1 Tax=Rhodococcus sp. IEGM 1408 TaxID=3082220 RepID=UPI002953630D|nr:CaiB/BaiF CoA-transferase family protein [Rhodococcus sp. IEGM 1408]MDV8001301.1 CaiB/BaiF CoA-transferase family protein [Rhodococcus sp. IEGM 1408]